MFIGYRRPLHDDPLCEEQQRILLGYKENTTIFTEEHASAKKRVALTNALERLQREDTLLVTNLAALADSTRHLVEVLEMLDQKEAFLFSIKEQIDTSHPQGYSFIDIVRHLVELQSDLISERTKRGLSEAKEKGIVTGRPRKPDDNVQRAIAMYESKNYSLADIKNETGISKSTLYRYLDRLT